MRCLKNLFKTKFGEFLTKLGVSRRFQPAIYSVVHEESESEVQNAQCLQENLNKLITGFHFFLCLNPIKGLTCIPHAFGCFYTVFKLFVCVLLTRTDRSLKAGVQTGSKLVRSGNTVDVYEKYIYIYITSLGGPYRVF